MLPTASVCSNTRKKVLICYDVMQTFTIGLSVYPSMHWATVAAHPRRWVPAICGYCNQIVSSPCHLAVAFCLMCTREQHMSSSSRLSNLETKTFITLPSLSSSFCSSSAHTHMCAKAVRVHALLPSNVYTHAHQLDTPILYTFTLMHTHTS